MRNGQRKCYYMVHDSMKKKEKSSCLTCWYNKTRYKKQKPKTVCDRRYRNAKAGEDR
jgi:hypothetical protein